MTDLTPLFSTLLGGVLTITGGVLAIYYSHRTSSQSETKKFLREKIEEIYDLNEERTSIVHSYLLNHFRYINNDNYDKAIDRLKTLETYNRLMGKIVLIVDLYFPSIKSSLIESNQKSEKHFNQIDQIKDPTEIASTFLKIDASFNIFRHEILDFIKEKRMT